MFSSHSFLDSVFIPWCYGSWSRRNLPALSIGCLDDWILVLLPLAPVHSSSEPKESRRHPGVCGTGAVSGMYIIIMNYIYKCHIYFVYFCIYIYIYTVHAYVYIYIHTRADWSGVMAWVSTLKALLMQHRAFAAEAGFAGRCFHHVQPYRLLRLEPTAKNRQLHLYNDFFGKLQKVWKGRLMPWTEQLVWLPAKCITIHCILPSFFGLTNT